MNESENLYQQELENQEYEACQQQLHHQQELEHQEYDFLFKISDIK